MDGGSERQRSSLVTRGLLTVRSIVENSLPKVDDSAAIGADHRGIVTFMAAGSRRQPRSSTGPRRRQWRPLNGSWTSISGSSGGSVARIVYTLPGVSRSAMSSVIQYGG